MFTTKVTYKDKVYSYTRDKYDRAVNKQEWWVGDELMFAECLGLPKLEDDGTASRDGWNVSRLEKLLWYKFCLTLRSKFDKINAKKLAVGLNEMINDEFKKQGYNKAKQYEMIKMVEKQFKKVNCIYE